MRVLKYSTEHLVCFEAKDEQKQLHHQIFEKENNSKPIAIYSAEYGKLHLADEFPKNANEYKYFNEMCEVIGFLYSLPKTQTASAEK